MTNYFRKTLCCATVVSCCLVWYVRADASQLLLSFDWLAAGGRQPCSTGPVEFVIGHGLTLFDPQIVGHGLRYWESGESGMIEISGINDFGFASLATALTDGTDDYLFLMDNPSGCPGFGGNIAHESFWLQGSPDLVGNQIDLIRLIVHDVDIQQKTDGVIWQANIGYEFWGNPVPEPSALLPLAFGALILRKRNRKP